MLKSFYHFSSTGRTPRIATWHFYTPRSTTTIIGHSEHKHRNARLSTRAVMPMSTLAYFPFVSATWRAPRRSFILPLVDNKRPIYDFNAVTSGRCFGSEPRATKKNIRSSKEDTEKNGSDVEQNARDSACATKQSGKKQSSVKSFKTISIANREEKSDCELQNTPDPTEISHKTDKTQHSIKSNNDSIDYMDESGNSEKSDPLESSDKIQHSIKSNNNSIDYIDKSGNSEKSDPLELSLSSSTTITTTTTTTENNSSHTLPTDELIQSQTMDWIHKVVIGYNLCPFAEKPIRLNIFTSTIVRGTNEDSILSTVLREMKSRTQHPGTTLVICPEYSPENFETFMSLMNRLEELPERKQEFRSKLSAVPFHPLYEFEPQEEYGNDSDSVENYVYRSPHPMILILRGTEVERALEKLEGDITDVSYRNLVLLKSAEETMGREKFVKVMRGEYVREMDVLMSYWKYIGYHDDPDKFKRR
ncbi:hypothetical protein ACHAW6_016187 [Cyclotella cf. meneghiniana]